MEITSYYYFEKPPVILDFGDCLIKFGLAGEHYPRFIFPSAMFTQEFKREKRTLAQSNDSGQRIQRRLSKVVTFVGLSEAEWIPILVSALKCMYNEYLLVDATERKILICESFLTTHAFRNAMATALFSFFEAPAICFLPQLVAPLYTCGMHTGIVVDVGYYYSRVMPTYYGVGMYSQFEYVDIGGCAIDANLKMMLMKSQKPEVAEKVERISASEIEDIKVRSCYIHFELADKKPIVPEDQYYCFPRDGISLLISGDARWKPCEVLFGAGEENDPTISLQSSIIKCLEKCPIDTRVELIQNVIFCGGTAEIKGFLTRIALELRDALKNHKSLAKLEEHVAFASPSFRPLCRQWIGASIHGMLKDLKEFTKEQYANGLPLPGYPNPPHH